MNIKTQKWLTFLVALVLALTVVACGGADETGQPGTDPGLGATTLPEIEATAGTVLETPAGVEETPIVGEEATAVGTAVVGEEATAVVGEEATAVGTPIVEEEATAAGTPVVSEEATAVGTPVTGEEGAMENAVIRSSTLIGLDIVDMNGQQVGQIDEVLVDMEGTVRYVIFDAAEFLGATEENTRAVDWNMFQIGTQGAGSGELENDNTGALNQNTTGTANQNTATQNANDNTTTGTLQEQDRNIMFIGTADDLGTATVIDATALDEDDLILNAQDLGLAAGFNNLIQVSEFAGVFEDFNLVNTAGEDLGEIEELLIDLEQGQVVYGVTDVGGFLGIAEKSVAVPWERFQFAAEDQEFVLDVDQAALENAPELDFTNDAWMDDGWAADPEWDVEIRQYWETT
jgi:sporulation protein YlmC with PRC-barrel domain